MRRLLLTASVLIAPASFAACAGDSIPSVLRATPDGVGPRIVFDLEHRPFPEIPFPNDVATVADPTSRTGLRVNASLIAPTLLERASREGFDDMEGWGTYATIAVRFAPEDGADARAPAIDVIDVARRMQGDDYEPTNDPIYLVDLDTGVPVPLDAGAGSFPISVTRLGLYWPNDPRPDAENVTLETAEEGAGLTQADYTPARDTDFDGVLDHPNTIGVASGGLAGVDDIATWYERETDTLLVRPLVPLKEKTRYAVVVTDRLRGPDGAPVRSPFPQVYHPSQARDVARVGAIFGDAGRARFFGDLAGTGLDHVAFAWSFTTQPVYEDLRLLRDGLYGRGPFASLSGRFPPVARAFRAAGLTTDPNEDATYKSDPHCTSQARAPFVARIADAQTILRAFFGSSLLSLDAATQQALLDGLQTVDHFVIGSFVSPYFLGDPDHEDPNGRFHLNFMNGTGDVRSDIVPFWIAVPKATATHAQPFPTTVWAHGTGLHADELVIRAGYFARQGVAMMAIDAPGHGLVLDAPSQNGIEALLKGACLGPWTNGLFASRARDLDGDGAPDSGGLLWSAHAFHTRDNVRQTVIDNLQAVRVLRGWDGVATTDQDYAGTGKPNLAGDFDGDGVPDIGGPKAQITASGDSYGGIVSEIVGAVDPFVAAAAPISGGGGLIDIASRSALVTDAVIEETVSPLVVALPASDRPPNGDVAQTACAAGERSVRFVVNSLSQSREVEIACLRQDELDAGRTILVRNASNQEKRCARAGADGRFRLPIPATRGDHLTITVWAETDAVDSYASCNISPGATLARTIATWEQAETATQPLPPGASPPPCEQGCQRFEGDFYDVGSQLVAPQDGLGLTRQSPDLRRLLTLVQGALDPADPINFARKYFLEPVPGLDGEALGPRGLLAANTVGDPFVPVATGDAFARAAGVLPFLRPDAIGRLPELAAYVTPQALYDAEGGRTPNAVVAERFVLEGIARLGRTHAGNRCGTNRVSTGACGAVPAPDPTTCATTLDDVDWLAEGHDLYDAPHPAVPLRLARTTARATDRPSLDAAWGPRLAGVPGGSDDAGWRGDVPLAAVVHAYLDPHGQHVWTFPDPCKAFDDAVYYDGLLARFLATGGRDLYDVTHPATHLCLADQSCVFPP